MQLPVQLPYVLGSDLAGVVTEIGTKVTQVKPGDRVMGIPVNNGGAYADYVAVEENALAAIELALSFQEAAALPTVGLTAWQALFKYGKLQPGQRILIHAGAGGVGKEQKLKVHLSGIYPFTAQGLTEAYQKCETNPKRGKVVIQRKQG